MDSNAIQAICKTVSQRFPEMKGARPSVQSYGQNQVLLVFKASAAAADGRSMQRTVRVVATKEGKISKITTSR